MTRDLLKPLIGFAPGPEAKAEVRHLFTVTAPQALGTRNPVAIFLAMCSLAEVWWTHGADGPADQRAVLIQALAAERVLRGEAEERLRSRFAAVSPPPKGQAV